jgi:hypothetical protein
LEGGGADPEQAARWPLAAGLIDEAGGNACFQVASPAEAVRQRQGEMTPEEVYILILDELARRP